MVGLKNKINFVQNLQVCDLCILGLGTQVGKKLSELIRDSENQVPSGEQGRWQSKLAQVATELILYEDEDLASDSDLNAAV